MSDTEIQFCHNATTVFYPAAPGRVYAVSFDALADSEVVSHAGEAQWWRDCTRVVDVAAMVTGGQLWPLLDEASDGTVSAWGRASDGDSWAEDLHAAVEAWAEWCDRDSAERDSEEAVSASIVRAA